MVARAAKSILCVNGENGLASDGTLQERYEYTPYGERRKRHDERFGPARFNTHNGKELADDNDST